MGCGASTESSNSNHRGGDASSTSAHAYATADCTSAGDTRDSLGGSVSTTKELGDGFRCVGQLQLPRQTPPTSVALDKSMQLLTSSSWDSGIILRLTSERRAFEVVADENIPTSEITALKENMLCFAAGKEATVWRIDSFDPLEVNKCELTRDANITACAFVTTDVLAVGETSGAIAIYNLTAAQLVEVLEFHRSPVACLETMHSTKYGYLGVSAASERGVKVWDADHGNLVNELPSAPQGGQLLTCSPNVLCVSDRYVTVHDPGMYVVASQIQAADVIKHIAVHTKREAIFVTTVSDPLTITGYTLKGDQLASYTLPSRTVWMQFVGDMLVAVLENSSVSKYWLEF